MIYVLNAGYLCMLIALTIRNILFLRIILISAQGLLIAYNLVADNYIILMWNCLFLAINLFQDNGQNAADNGANQWDGGEEAGGNYWSDHQVEGNPSREARPIPGGGVDRYPFADPWGWR